MVYYFYLLDRVEYAVRRDAEIKKATEKLSCMKDGYCVACDLFLSHL